MLFRETKFKGVFTIEIEPHQDERGFFARTFCQEEFKKQGLNFSIVQSSISYNRKKGTLRGMHYQTAPHQEAKLITCIKGGMYDVIVDLRTDYPTYLQWLAVELNSENYKSLYVPEGFAHGFQTLQDDTVVYYQMSEFYHPECARGVAWDDPSLKIKWPEEPIIISPRDCAFTRLKNA